MFATVLPLAIPLFAHGPAIVPSAGSGTAFEVGEPFPDLVLPSLVDGLPASIAQFRGKKVVLHVFASW